MDFIKSDIYKLTHMVMFQKEKPKHSLWGTQDSLTQQKHASFILGIITFCESVMWNDFILLVWFLCSSQSSADKKALSMIWPGGSRLYPEGIETKIRWTFTLLLCAADFFGMGLRDWQY